MPEKRKGIPGVTRPLDESVNSWQDYTPSEPKDHGLNQLIQAPKEIVGTGFQAAFGALSLLIARNLGISDPITKAEEEIKRLELKIEEGKGNKAELKEKLIKKQDFLNSINEGIKLSEQILQIREKYQSLLNDKNYLLSLLAEKIGNEGFVEIENNLLVSQGSKLEVKPVSIEEINLSQKIVAKSKNEGDRSILLKKYIQQLEKDNLINLGKQLLNLNKISEIKQTKDETDFNVNLVSWDEALLASILGATGRTNSSIRGGYKVRVEEGDMVVHVGKDRDHVAPLERITVDFDTPVIYEAALAVANQEVPLFKSKIISDLIKKAMGDNSLLPGRIDIGQTGSSDRVSYPALNIRQQVEHIEIASAAALEMEEMLEEIRDITIDINSNDEDIKEQLIAAGIEGALNIPRYSVVVDLMNQIDPAEADGLSGKFRFVEREGFPEDISDDLEEEETEEMKAANQKKEDLKKAGLRRKMNPKTAEAIVNNTETYQKKYLDRFGKKEGKRLFNLLLNEALDILDTDLETVQLNKDLAQAGFANGIDQRTAEKIIEYPENYLANYIEQFGEKEGRRLMKVIKKLASNIVDIDLKQTQAIHDLFLAGYSETMTRAQAKDFIDRIQLYRERLIKMYGLQQGNRIASNIRLIAKKTLEKDE